MLLHLIWPWKTHNVGDTLLYVSIIYPRQDITVYDVHSRIKKLPKRGIIHPTKGDAVGDDVCAAVNIANLADVTGGHLYRVEQLLDRRELLGVWLRLENDLQKGEEHAVVADIPRHRD